MGYCMNPECENDLLPDAIPLVMHTLNLTPKEEAFTSQPNPSCPNCHTKVMVAERSVQFQCCASGKRKEARRYEGNS